MTKLDRRDWLLLAGLTALAAALRFFQLGVVPPGFQFDEAYNALDAARVMAGDRPLFLPTNGGREVLYTYYQAALGSVFGLNLTTLRLASTLAGIVTVPVAYLLVRTLLRQDSRRIAAFTALVLAVSFWHLHFSHYGIRIILMPLILSGVFGFFWIGVSTGRLWPYVASGALAGLGVWNNPTGRLVPLVLGAFAIWLLWQHPEWRRLRWPGPIPGLVVTGGVALLVFLPLGLEFWRHPEFFLGHPGEVSVFADRVSAGSPLGALVQHAFEVLGMFNVRGDEEWIHNLAGRPVFDPLLSIPFVIGAALWVVRIGRRGDPDRDALVLLAIWSIIMLLPSVFSDMAPNFSRTLPALPAVFVASGLGLAFIVGLGERRSLPAVGWAAATLILVAGGAWAVRDYFWRFPQAAEAYYAYDADKLDALAYLEPLTAGNQVYISQLWGEHATIEFLRRDTALKSVETTDTVVLPPAGQGAVYAFPREQAGAAAALHDRLPGTQLEQVTDPQGNVLLHVVSLPADQTTGAAALPEPLARFAGAPDLQGAVIDTASGEFTLTWLGDEPVERSLTSFVHLIDRTGQRVSQLDKLPGNGSYPTQGWTIGEQVVERYRLPLPPCTEDGEVKAVAGWYDLAAGTAPLPRADVPGSVALVGRLSLPAQSVPVEQRQPAIPVDQPVAGDLILRGYELRGDDLQPGAPMVLDLVWQGEPSSAGYPVQVELAGEAGAETLWEGQVAAPGSRWTGGETICRRLVLQVPPDATPGAYGLQVRVVDQPVALAELAVAPSTRRFDVPVLAHDAGAVFGDQLRLAGYELSRADGGQAVGVTLAWQALGPIDTSYTAFVHLLDGEGRLVAQSDAVPAGGYATDRWLAGEVVVDNHTLPIPEDLVPGSYLLVAGLYDAATGQRLVAAAAGGQVLPEDTVPLGEVTLP